MNAGRELDAFVAERVMGFTRWVYPAHIGCSGAVLLNEMQLDARPEFWRKTGLDEVGEAVPLDERQDHVPHYSTDSAAALQVVEQFREWKISKHEDPRSTPYECVVWIARDVDVFAEAATAPLAICLAALRAVGAA